MATTFDVGGLADDWDSSDSLRDRLRAGKSLAVLPTEGAKADATIVECVANADVLIPCLHRLLPAQLKMPPIGPLIGM